MPSNALKISQLIAHLQNELADHGDLDCVLCVSRDNALIAIDGRNISIAAELLGQRLAQPALVFGLLRDDNGRPRSSAGHKYESSADSGEWSYDRASAPEGIDLIVWKRRGGLDRGYRLGERWYVHEGAVERPAKPLEIVPAGVLAWKLP